MKRDKESFRTWNKIAKVYQDKFMDIDIYNESYDLFLKSIPSQKGDILDLGCGPGNITKYLMSQDSSLNIHGVDISPNMISLAIKNNPAARFSVLDCREINCLEDQFDGIIGGFCLPYLSQNDCKKLIEDCKNLLNPKGVLYLSFVEGSPSESGYQNNSSGDADRVYFYYHTLERLKEQLQLFGFNISKVMNASYRSANNSLENHTIILSVKKD